jgi:putative N6-adenine-specific DNA methylase
MEELMEMTAKCQAGMEEILQRELTDLGAREVKTGRRAVYFKGDTKLLYAANYRCRTALKFLVPIFQFTASSPEELYAEAMNKPWEKIMRCEQTFSTEASVHSPHFTHSKYAALKLKDAIADSFRKHMNKRPSVDPEKPDVAFNLHIDRTVVTISLDSTVDPLFKRNYRQPGILAPISETLAAGMIMLSGWHGEKDFYDPMCGSGTLLMEAALIAGNIAPQKVREDFGFFRWKDFDEKIWKEVLDEAEAAERPIECKIYGSDIDRRQAEITKQNMEDVGMGDVIEVEHADFRKLQPKGEDGLIVMNPPYDERLKSEDIEKFYSEIGDALKQNWKGFKAWIISANFDALKRVGLKPSRKIPLQNGSLECKFQKYEMYAGSKKRSKNPEMT